MKGRQLAVGVAAGLVAGALAAAVAWLRPPLPRPASSTVLEQGPLRWWVDADEVEVESGAWRPRRERVVVWLESPRPPGTVVLHLEEGAMALEAPAARFLTAAAEEGFSRRRFLEWTPSSARRRGDPPSFFHRLELRFPDLEDHPEPPRLVPLGAKDDLSRDRYALAWGGCGAPRSVRAGERFRALARLTNTSLEPWPHAGPARVRLGYRWLGADGRRLGDGALVTELIRTVAPGEEIVQWQEIRAPTAAGTWTLELDPRFDPFVWFSRRGAATCQAVVTVLQA